MVDAWKTPSHWLRFLGRAGSWRRKCFRIRHSFFVTQQTAQVCPCDESLAHSFLQGQEFSANEHPISKLSSTRPQIWFWSQLTLRRKTRKPVQEWKMFATDTVTKWHIPPSLGHITGSGTSIHRSIHPIPYGLWHRLAQWVQSLRIYTGMCLLTWHTFQLCDCIWRRRQKCQSRGS